MIGTIINVTTIVVGGFIGIKAPVQIPIAWQLRIKTLLGVFTVYVGLSMCWQGLNGTFFLGLKQLAIAVLSMIIGKVIGQVLKIQKGLNKLGEQAKARLAKPGDISSQRFSEGFITCSLLFCVGPMSLVGAIQDGMLGSSKTLIIKSVMDGLASMAFSRTFGWGAVLAAVPVLTYQGTITIASSLLEPILHQQDLLDSISLTGGLLIFSVALVLLEIKKVELANYIPALFIAPLITWLLR
jgi:uncharacterized membrane protein YqgA involved in biofilm formation